VRTVLGEYRAVKVVYRRAFGDNRPFEREFEGIQRYEPVSRSHPSQVHILHVGINQSGGYFYYVMELADDSNAECRVQNAELKEDAESNSATPQVIHHSALPIRTRPAPSATNWNDTASCPLASAARSAWR